MRILIALLLSTASLWAQPAQIILIRHAEKPAQGICLSLRGRERAAALVPCFLGFPTLLHYGRPSAIFAAKPNGKDPSIRSVQTVMVLADELDLPVQKEFGYGDTEKLVETIQNSEEYEGKMVLICWPHAELPKLAAQLGAKKAPKNWAEGIFDRFWILSYEDNGVKFENLPQRLLYGDANR